MLPFHRLCMLCLTHSIRRGVATYQVSAPPATNQPVHSSSAAPQSCKSATSPQPRRLAGAGDRDWLVASVCSTKCLAGGNWPGCCRPTRGGGSEGRFQGCTHQMARNALLCSCKIDSWRGALGASVLKMIKLLFFSSGRLTRWSSCAGISDGKSAEVHQSTRDTQQLVGTSRTHGHKLQSYPDVIRACVDFRNNGAICICRILICQSFLCIGHL